MCVLTKGKIITFWGSVVCSMNQVSFNLLLHLPRYAISSQGQGLASELLNRQTKTGCDVNVDGLSLLFNNIVYTGTGKV